jgi:hypothetical protein
MEVLLLGTSEGDRIFAYLRCYFIVVLPVVGDAFALEGSINCTFYVEYTTQTSSHTNPILTLGTFPHE